LKDIVLRKEQPSAPADDTQSIEDLHELLLDAVKMRLVSDVPIGAFLSGGIDSSLIVALMARAHGTDVRTFTIGFDAKEFDESDYARQVAKHLGVNNTVEILSGDQVLRELPTVVQHCDEPMADYSILPAIAVSRMARRHITVALTGDGADELFGGYRYYVAVWAFAWYARMLPQVARSQLARLHSLSPNPGVGRMVRRSAARGTGEFFGQSGFYRGPTAGPAMASILPGDIGLSPPEQEVAEDFRSYHGLHAVERALLYDATHTLPDAWLQKVDRASMAASLEARSPFMDKRVVEAAFRLKLLLRVRPTGRKYVLRRLLSRYLPVELIERPKRGFTAPLGEWFRTDLRELVTDMLSEARLKRRGYFQASGVQAVLRQTIEGQANFSQLLWALLLLEMWFDRFVDA
jgi:asparagine synthase (glutamine-hydrolysing)